MYTLNSLVLELKVTPVHLGFWRNKGVSWETMVRAGHGTSEVKDEGWVVKFVVGGSVGPQTHIGTSGC